MSPRFTVCRKPSKQSICISARSTHPSKHTTYDVHNNSLRRRRGSIHRTPPSIARWMGLFVSTRSSNEVSIHRTHIHMGARAPYVPTQSIDRWSVIDRESFWRARICAPSPALLTAANGYLIIQEARGLPGRTCHQVSRGTSTASYCFQPITVASRRR